MKLRLPNKLIAAIVAAATPVLFSTLSTATLGAAAVATLSQQAVGDVSITTNTIWDSNSTDIPDSGNVSVDGNGAFLTITTNAGSAQQSLNEFELKNGGDVTISGEGTNVYVTRMLLHNASSSNGEVLTIGSGATLNVTKAATATGYQNSALLIGHWPSGNKDNVQVLVNEGGTLNVLGGWTHMSRDSGGSLIVNGGTANLKGIEYDNDRTHESVVSLTSGTLNIGSLGIVDNHSAAVTSHKLNLSGGTLGTLDSDWTFKNIILTLGNTATISTTKTTGEAAGQGAAITLDGGSKTAGAGVLAVTGAGTLSVANGATLGHTGGTQVADGATLALGTGVTLSSGISNTGTGVVNVAGTLTNTGASSDFTQAKLTLTQPISGGNYTYGGVLTTEVSGNGIAESATLHRVITGVTESAVDGAVVYVGGEAAATAWADNALNVKTNIGNYYVVNDTASFTNAADFNGTKGLVVQNNATMTLGVSSNAGGAIHGTVEVKSGSTLKTTVSDTMGWGDTAVTSLLVENGATVELAHGGNETFVGALMLNGTITGNSGSTWDMYSSGTRVSSLSVGDGQTATISTANLRLRHDNVDFNIGTGATLNVSANITKNEGNGTLVKSGAGVMNLTGTLGGISALSLQGGTLKLNHDITLSGANKITGSGNLQILGGTTQLGGGDNGSFTGNILVSGEGAELKLLGNNTGLGAANRDNTARVIKAENGGVINFNGQYDGATYNYAITLGNNGSLVNKGGDMFDSKMQLAKLYVTGSNATAYVGGTALFGLLAQGYNGTTLQLNGNTLEKVGTNNFMLISTTVSNGGTIRLTGGKILIGTSAANRATTAQNVNFEFNGGELNIGTNANPGLTAGGLTMKSGYEGNGSITGGGHLTLALGNNANNTYRGTMAIGNLTVNGGQNRTQTLNLTDASTAGNISVTGGANMVLTSDNGAVLSAGQATVNNADSSFRIDGAQLNLTSKMQVSASGQTGHFTMTSGGLKATTMDLWKLADVNILGGSLEFTGSQGFTFSHGGDTAKSTTNMGYSSTTGLSADGAVVLKATSNDWSIKLKNDAILNLGNVTIDSANTHNITLQSADGSSSGTLNLYGTVTNNAQFTLGGTLNVLGDGKTEYYVPDNTENGFSQQYQQWTLVKGGEGATTTLADGTTAANHATYGALTLTNTNNTVTAESAKITSTIYYVGKENTVYNAEFAAASAGATGYFVREGNTFTAAGTNLTGKELILNEGATFTSAAGGTFGNQQIQSLKLEGDATVEANSNVALIGSGYADTTLTLAGHTLTVTPGTGDGHFALYNTTVDAGTIAIASGANLQTGHNGREATINALDTLLSFDNGTLQFGSGASTVKAEGLTGTGTLAYEGSSTTRSLQIEANLSSTPYAFTGNLGTGGLNVTMLATSTGEQQFNLTQNATLGSITVNGGKLTFGGSSTLTAGAATLGNGTLALNTTANLTEITATSGTTSTLTGTGAISLSTAENEHGLLVQGGTTVNVEANNLTIANGALYNKGTLNIGNGTDATLVKAKWLVNGNINEAAHRSSALNIASNATVAITGGDTSNTHATGLMFSEWNNNTTATISGKLLAQNATFKGGDWGYFLNIEKGGVLAALNITSKASDSTISLKDGGSLILGGTADSSDVQYSRGTMTAQAGSTIGIYADSVSFARNMTLTAAAGKAVTIDTKKYAFNADGTAIDQADAATGGTLTISGNLSGDGALTVIGNGALVLSGNNTYSGATTVTGGSVTYSNAFNGSVLNLSGDGTTVTFNGAGSSFSGYINADAAGGTLNVGGTAPLTANTISITAGTTLNFDRKVTLTLGGSNRPELLFNTDTKAATQVNFNGGYAYTGSNSYALCVGKDVTVSMGGTSDLTGKSIGLAGGATLTLQNAASLTVGTLNNSTTPGNNGTVNVGASATLAVTGTNTNRITELHLGNASTTSFNSTTSLETLSVDGTTANLALKNDGGALTVQKLLGGSDASLELYAEKQTGNLFKVNMGADGVSYTDDNLFAGTLWVTSHSNQGGSERSAINMAVKAEDVLKNATVNLSNWKSNYNNTRVIMSLESDAKVAGINSANTGAYDGAGSYIRSGAMTNNTPNGAADMASTGDTARTLEITGSGVYSTNAHVMGNVNITMNGEGTQTFTGDMSAFNGNLVVENGVLDIDTDNIMQANRVEVKTDRENGLLMLKKGTTISVNELVLSKNAAVITKGEEAAAALLADADEPTAYSGEELTAHVTVGGNAEDRALLQTTGGSTVSTDLTLAGNTDMVYSDTKQGEGISLNNHSLTLTLSSDGGKIYITEAMMEVLDSTHHLTLFTDVSGLTLNGDIEMTETTYHGEVIYVAPASKFFADAQGNALADQYTVAFKDGELFLAPEPATTALGLLALAGLAARRRRK